MAKATKNTESGVIAPALPPTETYTEKDSLDQLREPNIIFIGKRMVNGELIPDEPFNALHTVHGGYKLPDAETQLAGFYHEHAKAIIKEWPQYYKEFKKKGAK